MTVPEMKAFKRSFWTQLTQSRDCCTSRDTNRNQQDRLDSFFWNHMLKEWRDGRRKEGGGGGGVGERRLIAGNRMYIFCKVCQQKRHAVRPACVSLLKDNWQTVTQIRGRALGEWSQTGISRKWRERGEQEQRDLLCMSAVRPPLLCCTLARLSGTLLAYRNIRVGVCVCVCLAAEAVGGWAVTSGGLLRAVLRLTQKSHLNIMIQ